MSERSGESHERVRAVVLGLLVALCALFLSGGCHDAHTHAQGEAAARHDRHHCAPVEAHVAAQPPAGRAQPHGPGGTGTARASGWPWCPVPYDAALRADAPAHAAGYGLLVALGVDRN
ncbi:hypothetical protein [Streptomyces beihaiensis]|uniref:Uncharacterized protein n=1 Tax=Streptomyces beihaiensis TaxID=2984495 RepID=A0ABT3U095_9ACTN|nr:hypothetical protein [Streptomyces beihaiensis]MCX3062721.1 hypothetical protein [Streptomyces beihaiensis]